MVSIQRFPEDRLFRVALVHIHRLAENVRHTPGQHIVAEPVPTLGPLVELPEYVLRGADGLIQPLHAKAEGLTRPQRIAFHYDLRRFSPFAQQGPIPFAFRCF